MLDNLSHRNERYGHVDLMSGPDTFGARLKRLRLDMARRLGRSVPQAEVAAAVGVARSTVGAYEKDHDRPGRDTAAAFADFYNVSIDYLIGNSVNNTSSSPKVAQGPEEAEWLGFWRDMNDAQRRRAIALLRAMIEADAA